MRLFNDRLVLAGPDAGWKQGPETGEACDEWGNCSFFLKTRAFGVTVFWEPSKHYQHDVKLPAPGRSRWVDRRYYPESGK